MKLKAKYKKTLICVGIVAITTLLVGGIIYFMTNSSICFVDDRHIEVNSDVDYATFIKNVEGGNVEDVDIDSSAVDTKKVGDYQIIYKYKDNQEVLWVKVIDSVAPKFEVVDKTVALNQTIDPQELVKDIEDNSKTTVEFKKAISFNTVGKQSVEVSVIDEYRNITTKKVQVTVKEDTNAPVITVSNESFVIGQTVDLEKLARVTDDLDSRPTLVVNKNNLNTNQLGKYTVEFIGRDASGNESKESIVISIIEKTKANEKVVYLTFDDGPSKFTPEVLKILDKYNSKATFFITGMNSSYRKYIKEASDKGHTIGLHTYSHNYAKLYASTDAYFKDLTKIGNLAKDYLGYVPKYIRFPGGSSNSISKKYNNGIMTKLTKMVEKEGYIYYDWNAENGDGYKDLSQKEMLRRATLSKQNHIMMLMHDANGKQSTVDILPQVIEYYQNKGYTFKSIDDSTFAPHQRINN